MTLGPTPSKEKKGRQGIGCIALEALKVLFGMAAVVLPVMATTPPDVLKANLEAYLPKSIVETLPAPAMLWTGFGICATLFLIGVFLSLRRKSMNDRNRDQDDGRDRPKITLRDVNIEDAVIGVNLSDTDLDADGLKFKRVAYGIVSKSDKQSKDK